MPDKDILELTNKLRTAEDNLRASYQAMNLRLGSEILTLLDEFENDQSQMRIADDKGLHMVLVTQYPRLTIKDVRRALLSLEANHLAQYYQVGWYGEWGRVQTAATSVST